MRRSRWFRNDAAAKLWIDHRGLVPCFMMPALREWLGLHGVLLVEIQVYGFAGPGAIAVAALALHPFEDEFKSLVLRARYRVDLRKSIELQAAMAAEGP